MFYEKFIELCDDNDIKPTKALQEIGISKGSITNYKNGTSPSDSTLKKISNYFKVDISYFDDEYEKEEQELLVIAKNYKIKKDILTIKNPFCAPYFYEDPKKTDLTIIDYDNVYGDEPAEGIEQGFADLYINYLAKNRITIEDENNRTEKRLQISNGLKIIKEEILDLNKKPKEKGIKIPVLGHVAAGQPISAIEDIIDYEEITRDMAIKGEYFGLVLKGDSMEPRMTTGDVVIVRSQPTAETGDIAIVLIGNEEGTCKKIKKTPEGIMLISLNPAYEPMFYSNKQIEQLPITIVGKVVELRAKF